MKRCPKCNQVDESRSDVEYNGVFTMTKQDLIDYCLTFPAAYEDYPFDGMDAHSDDGTWTVMRHSTMEVLEDADSKEMIWQDGDTKYYENGVTDPDYCVLKFTAQNGRFYSNFKSEDFEI